MDPNAAPPPEAPPEQSKGLPQPPEYWGKGWAKDDGAFDHSRFDKAPEELKPLKEELGRYKSLDDLLKSHKNLRELASKKGISEPLGKEATPEQRAEHMALVRKAIGAPDNPEGYVIEKPKDLPDTHWDQKAVGEAAKIAFEEGVSPAALQKLVAYETQRGIAAAKAEEARVTQMWAEQDKLIRDTASKEGMDYAKARDLAERAGRKFFGIDKDNPLFQNATAMMGLARIGKAMSEDGLVTGETANDLAGVTTPETALKAAKSIQADRAHPDWGAYWNRDDKTGKEINHPRHDEVVAKVNKLLAMAYKDRPMRK